MAFWEERRGPSAPSLGEAGQGRAAKIAEEEVGQFREGAGFKLLSSSGRDLRDPGVPAAPCWNIARSRTPSKSGS